MKLPSLDDLNLDEEKPVKRKARPSAPKKQTETTRKTDLKKTPQLKEESKKKVQTKKTKATNKPTTSSKNKVQKKQPRVPKSQYDAEGNPILTIPDLDDVNLTDEINKFLGEEDD